MKEEEITKNTFETKGVGLEIIGHKYESNEKIPPGHRDDHTLVLTITITNNNLIHMAIFLGQGT